MKSYPIDSVVFRVIKSSIGNNFYSCDLNSPSTPQNGAAKSIINGITTPFLFSNIEPNYLSVKKVLNTNIQNIFLRIKFIFNVRI